MSAPPSQGPPPRSPSRLPAGRPAWIVLAAAAIVLGYITINTLRTTGPGSRGPAIGSRIAPFAAPLATSNLVGDANVARRRDEGSAGARPACDVTDPRALNVCTLERRGPLVLAFLTTDAGKCVRQLDTLATVAPRFPQVGFAAVAVRGDRAQLAALVRRHGWPFPVAQDRDGAVSDLYGVAICPTVVFAARGGTVRSTALGGEVATPAKLAARVRALERTAG
jgi:peroxiredoxin